MGESKGSINLVRIELQYKLSENQSTFEKNTLRLKELQETVKLDEAMDKKVFEEIARISAEQKRLTTEINSIFYHLGKCK